jgi:non-heme chloroperoxidase
MTERETEQIDRANATDRAPVVFIHGLWLLPNCWERWTTIFEEAGYAAVTPGWPDDPETVGEARAHPEVFARKKIEQIADRYAEIIGRLSTKPAIIGHSFGGLLTMIMAGRGLSSASVAHQSRALPRRAARSDCGPQGVLAGSSQPGQP